MTNMSTGSLDSRACLRGKARAVGAAALAMALALLMALSYANIAFAASTDDDSTENASNLFGSSGDGERPTLSDEHIDRDLYWAGADLSFNNIETGGDIIIAGMNLALFDSTAKGSVRMAGMNLDLSGVNAKGNFTVAGQTIDMASCAAGGGVYCAGKTVSFDGTAKGGFFAAGDVYINGQINGNVEVSCDKLELGPNAIITGVLSVEAKEQPTIAKSASVGKLEFEDTSAEEDEAADVAGAGLAALGGLAIASKAIGLVSAIVLALLLVWLFRRPVEAATAMTRRNAGRVFATGAIAAVAAPVLTIVLLCLVVTIPAAFALALALAMLTVIAIPFAAASLSRLVFPKMNRFGAAAIGALVLGIVNIIPFVGTVLTIAAFMFVLGYSIQTLWETRRGKAEADEPAEPAVQAAPAAPVPPTTPMGE